MEPKPTNRNTKTRGKRSWRSVLGRVSLYLILGCVLIIGALHIPPVRTAVLNNVLSIVNPFAVASIEFDRARGSVFSQIVLTGVEISEDSETLLSIDTLTVDLNLFDVLRNNELEGVSISGGRIILGQNEAGVWSIPSLKQGDPDEQGESNRSDEPNDSDEPSAPFVLNRISITGLSASFNYWNSGRDSSWTVLSFETEIRELAIGNTFSALVDSVAIQFVPAMSPDTVRVHGSATLIGNRLEDIVLSLHSPGSSIYLSGTMPLDSRKTQGAQAAAVQFNVDASRLALRDISPFVNGLNQETTIGLHATVDGTWDNLAFNLESYVSENRVIWGSGSLIQNDTEVRFETNFEIESLQLADILTSAGPLETIDGSAHVNLRGPSLSKISGSLRIDLEHTPTQSGSERSLFDEIHLGQEFIDGTGQFSLAITSQHGTMDLSGWIRPFDPELTWKADGAFDFYRSQTPQTDLSGFVSTSRTLVAESGDNTFIISVAVDIDDGTMGACEVTEGAVNMSAIAGKISASGHLELCDSQLAEINSSFPVDAPWTLSGKFTDLDIFGLIADSTALASDPTDPAQSSFSGSVAIYGPTGTRSEISGDAILTRSSAYSIELDSSRIHFEIGTDLVSSSIALFAAGASVEADFSLDLSQPGVHLNVSQLTFDSVNISALLGDSDSESHIVTDLNGSAQLTLSINDENQITSSGSASLRPSTLNNVASQQVELAWQSIPGSIQFDVLAAFHPDARVSFSGRLSRNFDELTMNELEGTFSNLNIESLAAAQDIQTDLTGSFSMAGNKNSGFLTVEAEDGSRINTLDMTAFQLHTTWDQSHVKARSHLESETGKAMAEGSFSRGELQGADIEFEIESFDVMSLLGPMSGIPDSLFFDVNTRRSEVSVNGTISRVDDDWSISASDIRASVLGLSINEGIIKGHMDENELTLDSLTVSGGFGSVVANGTFDLKDTGNRKTILRLNASLQSTEKLGPFRYMVPVTWSNLDLSVTVSGSPAVRRFEGRVESGNVHYGSSRIAFIQSEFRGEFGEGLDLVAAELEGDLEIISFGNVKAESMDLDAEYVDGMVTAHALLLIDRKRKILAEATFDPEQDPIQIRVDEFIADLDSEMWQLTAPADITFGDLPSTSGLIIKSQNGHIAVTSVTMGDSDVMLINMENFNLDSVSDVFGFDGLGGEFDGRMTVTRRDTVLSLEGAFTGVVESYDIEAGSLDVQVSMRNDLVRFTADMTHVSGQTLELDGLFDIRENDEAGEDSTDGTVTGTVNMSLRAREFQIDWLLPFLDRSVFDALSGKMTTDLAVHGSFDAPDVSGTFQLSDGKVGLSALGKRGRGLTYTDITADLVLDADSIRINTLSAKSGSGTLTASGTLALRKLSVGEFALDVRADKFLAVDNAIYQAVIDGDLQLSGTTSSPVLSGNLILPTATYYLTNESVSSTFETVVLTDEDLLAVERSFGIIISESDTSSFDLYSALKIEKLSISLARDSWLRSKITPKMDIQFIGDLDITKEPYSDPVVFGNFEVLPDRSQIVQFGRKFRITRGTVALNGRIDNPVVDIEATYEVPSRSSSASEVVIRFLIQGEMEALNLTFESDPQMELSDVISYIVTGRPAGESLQLSSEGGQYGGTATALALGPMNAMAETIAGEGLGLDVVEVSYDANWGLKFVGGKYLNPQLYVAVSQPLSTTSNTDITTSGQEHFTSVTIEYEVFQDVLASFVARGGVLTYGIRWRYDF